MKEEVAFFVEILSFLFLAFLEKWKLENQERIKESRDKRNLVFFYLCLVGRMKKWRDEKFICLVERKIR